MSGFGTIGSQPVGSTRTRKGAVAPKKRPGIGAQPDYSNRKSHQPGSFRHTVESHGQPYAQLTTRKRA